MVERYNLHFRRGRRSDREENFGQIIVAPTRPDIVLDASPMIPRESFRYLDLEEPPSQRALTEYRQDYLTRDRMRIVLPGCSVIINPPLSMESPRRVVDYIRDAASQAIDRVTHQLNQDINNEVRRIGVALQLANADIEEKGRRYFDMAAHYLLPPTFYPPPHGLIDDPYRFAGTELRHVAQYLSEPSFVRHIFDGLVVNCDSGQGDDRTGVIGIARHNARAGEDVELQFGLSPLRQEFDGYRYGDWLGINREHPPNRGGVEPHRELAWADLARTTAEAMTSRMVDELFRGPMWGGDWANESIKHTDDAKRKGEELLRDVLGAVDYEKFKADGYIDIPSQSNMNKAYRIRHNQRIGIVANKSGKWEEQAESLCIAIKQQNSYVQGDRTAGLVLLAKYDEKKLNETANRFNYAAVPLPNSIRGSIRDGMLNRLWERPITHAANVQIQNRMAPFITSGITA